MVIIRIITTILISICMFSCNNEKSPKSIEVSIELSKIREKADSLYNDISYKYDSIIISEQLKLKSDNIKICSDADSVIKKTYNLWYKSDSLYKQICFDIDNLKHLNNE